MIETAVKMIASKVGDHWDSVLAVGILILYGRNDYRVSKLEKADKARSVAECDNLMGKCCQVN